MLIAGALSLLPGPAAAGEEAEAEEKTAEAQDSEPTRLLPFRVSGSASIAAIGRFTGNDSDFDLRGSFSVRVGDRYEDAVNAFLSASFNLDADGGTDTFGYNVTEGSEDSFHKAFFGQLLEAGIDLNSPLNPVKRVRLGRQVSESFHPIRFDGASLCTEEIELFRGVRLSAMAFGGLPVHFFEDRPWGDACFGVSIKATAGKTLSLGLHGVWARDRTSTWGIERDDRSTRAVLEASWKPDASLCLRGHLGFMELGSSDLQMILEEFKVAGKYRVPGAKLFVNAELMARFAGARNSAAEFNPYETILGEAGAYQRGRLGLLWLPARELELSLTASAYNAEHEAATADSDMVSARLSAHLKEVPLENLSLALTGELFDLSGAGFSAGLSAEAGYRLFTAKAGAKRRAAELRASGGFCPFVRPALGTELRENVVSAAISFRWWPLKELNLGVEFSFENDDFDAYYKVAVKAGIVF